ncbi:MAG: sodium:solute symporter family protein [Planctomycetaceae bacterium]
MLTLLAADGAEAADKIIPASTELAIGLTIYLLAIFGLSIYASRKVSNEEDYVVAGRRLPLFLAWGTLLATWFGAATILGAAEATRDGGIRDTLLDPWASGCALIIAGLFFAKPLWEMKLLTMGDFYGRVYGKRTETIASMILVPGYFGWIGAQFIALAAIQTAYFPIEGLPEWGSIIFVASLILIYTLVGGMWSVTLTDTLQLVVLLFGLLVLGEAVFSTLGNGSIADGANRLLNESDPDALTLLPLAGLPAGLIWLGTLGSGFFGNVPGQDLMQRVFASKDSKTAVWACLLAGVAYLAFGMIPLAMGLASKILVPEETDQKILTILASQFLSPTMTAVFVVSLISIVVSTATSAVLAPATILGHNLMLPLMGKTVNKLALERFAVFLMVSGGVVLALSGEKILGLLELTLSTVFVALFVPLLMGLFGRPRGQLPAILAMIFGISLWLARELMEGLLLPMPEEFEDQFSFYADYVHAKHLTGSTVRDSFLYTFALFPSAILGITASFIGYFVGQKLNADVPVNPRPQDMIPNATEGETVGETAPA